MITVSNNDVKSINAALIANQEALKKEVAQSLEIENAKHADIADNAINATQTYAVYCTADATFDNNVASITVDTPTGLTMSVGSTLKVCFTKELQDANAINEVKLTYGGVTAPVKSARENTTVNVISHLLPGGIYDSNYPNKVWDKYTTLELLYTGSEWLVMCNPVLCSYASSSDSYTVYSNGLIKQWGLISGGTQSSKRIDLNVSYSTSTSYSIQVSSSSGSTCYFSNTNASYFTVNIAGGYTNERRWFTIGY